jgi:hypothetical protein
MAMALFRGVRSPQAWIFARVLTILVSVSLSFYMGCIIFTSVLLPCGGVLVACIPGRATILDIDETDPGTRVYAIRCAWAPIVTSYLIRQ